MHNRGPRDVRDEHGGWRFTNTRGPDGARAVPDIHDLLEVEGVTPT